jgi:hypothetical protein
MRLLLLLAVVVFVVLPLDAQLVAVGLLRGLWLTDAGQAFLWGALGAAILMMAWSTVLWNSFAHALYREDVERAKGAYERRKR